MIDVQKSDVYEDGWLNQNGTLTLSQPLSAFKLCFFAPSSTGLDALELRLYFGRTGYVQQKIQAGVKNWIEVKHQEDLTLLHYNTSRCFLPDQTDLRLRSILIIAAGPLADS